MNREEIILHYDDLMRLAVSKCGSRTEAEDLVGDTMLAAFAYLHKGEKIAHPKNWLANTLCHKYNDHLRRKYRIPTTLCLDHVLDALADVEEDSFSSEEAANVRKELNHLALITREVIIRYYFGAQSIPEIADDLGIPEGTVKSRLSAGRNQIRKGLETMETRNNALPGQLYLSYGGSDGTHGEPISLVEDDLIAQNLLILAYEKPITVSDLSKAISIPAAYIEPIIRKLVDAELMVQTDSGKVYTDFIITKPQDKLKNFKPQLDFAHQHFETIWHMLSQMSERISELSFVIAMNPKQKTELDRYAVLKALQDFQHFGIHKMELPKFPKRKDGGWWIAQAIAIEAGYNRKEYHEAANYAVQGGHRTLQSFVDGGTRRVRLYEFDTTLWDSPHRYGDRYDLYSKYICPLLFSVYTGQSIHDHPEIPDEFLTYIPMLEELGLLKSGNGKLNVAIPVLKDAEYDEVCAVIRNTTAKLKTVLGNEFSAFVSSMKTPIPKHLTSVPELFRYTDATSYFVMAIIREAYEKGLHLRGIADCCPPVVLSYGDKG